MNCELHYLPLLLLLERLRLVKLAVLPFRLWAASLAELLEVLSDWLAASLVEKYLAVKRDGLL